MARKYRYRILLCRTAEKAVRLVIERAYTLTLATLLISLLASSVFAQTSTTWTSNVGDERWETQGNWNNGFQNDGSFHVIFDRETNANDRIVYVGVNGVAVAGMNVANNAGYIFNLDMTAGNPAITSTGIISLGNATLNVSGYSLQAIDSYSGPTALQTIIRADGGLSRVDVGRITVTDNASTDYLRTSVQANDHEINVSTGLTWDTTREHGNFTITGNNQFTLNYALTDVTPANNAVWDGTSLTKRGTGTLILTAENTYSGLTTVEQGILQLSSSTTSTASLAGDVLVQGKATFKIDQHGGNIAGTLTFEDESIFDVGTLTPGWQPLTVDDAVTIGSDVTLVFDDSEVTQRGEQFEIITAKEFTGEFQIAPASGQKDQWRDFFSDDTYSLLFIGEQPYSPFVYSSSREAAMHLQKGFLKHMPKAMDVLADPIANRDACRLWATFTGEWSRHSAITDANIKYSGYDIRSTGVAVGMDCVLPQDYFSGLMLAYDNAYQDFGGMSAVNTIQESQWFDASNQVNAFRSLFYLGQNVDNIFGDIYVCYTKNWHKTARDTESGNRANSKHHDNLVVVGLEISQKISNGRVSFVPSLGLHYKCLLSPKIVEQGGGQDALVIEKSSYSSLRMPIGAKLNLSFTGRFGTTWSPEFRAFYVREMEEDAAIVRANIKGAPYGVTHYSNITNGAKGYNSGLFGFGVNAQMRHRWNLRADYEYEVFDHMTVDMFSATLGVKF